MTDHSGSESYRPLYHEPWWIEAAAPGVCGRVEVEAEWGEIATLPYMISRWHGLTRLVTPPLTQFLGPWLPPQKGKYEHLLSREHRLMEELISRLPAYDWFEQSLSPMVTNCLPFIWAGFTATVRYTYRLDGPIDTELVWDEMRNTVRTDIRKAQRTVTIKDDLGIDELIRMVAMTFNRQSKTPLYSPELIKRIEAACAERNRRRMLFAVDEKAQVHAAILLVWDEKVCYYLMSGADPGLRSSGATSLLIWEGIQAAATMGKTFDFEGSILEPVERVCRAFGGKQMPYYRVSRASRRYQILKSGHDMLSSLLGRPIQ